MNLVEARQHDAQINQHAINQVPLKQRLDGFFDLVSPFYSSSKSRTVLETSRGPDDLETKLNPSAIAVMSRKSRAQGVASQDWLEPRTSKKGVGKGALVFSGMKLRISGVVNHQFGIIP